MKAFDRAGINKILVIKPAAIGDVLLAAPVIENLRHNFPQGEIFFLTQKYCREVLKGNPFLNAILTYDLNTDSSYCLIKNIRKQRYDLVIDLFCNPRTAFITFMSRAKYRVGYKFRLRSYAYNIKVEPRGNEVHNIDFNLDALRKLGLDVITRQPCFYLSDIYKEYADKFLKENNLNDRQIIGINPAGSWETKVWYPEKFSELIKLLDRNFKFLLFWGNQNEKDVAEKIKKNSDNNVMLIPEVDLKMMSALIKKCSVFITHDSGPMHIASVIGVPVVAIFGPTNPKLQGPVGSNSIVVRNEILKCLGCNLTNLQDCKFNHACMKDLNAENVFMMLPNL